MIIQRINKIKDYRIFSDFSWPSDLSDFKQYNLIYGWNGSGKTTLANIFRAIEKKLAITEGELEITIDGKKVAGSNFHNESSLPQVRVFNRDFVSKNVFTEHGSITPIFFFGEESGEKQKKIKELNGQVGSKQLELSKKKDDKDNKEKVFEAFCIDQAKSIKTLLSSSGHNTYNNYDKASFKSKCEELAKSANRSIYILSEDESNNLKKQKEATAKEKIQSISLSFPDLDALTKDAANILSQTVVSQALGELKNDPALSDWVKVGLNKHKNGNTEKCLFCGQKLPKERLQELEDHFNDQYNRFIDGIDTKLVSLDRDLRPLQNFQAPDKAKLYDHLVNSYQSAFDELNQQVSSCEGAMKSLKEELEDKKGKPFLSLSLKTQVPNIDRLKLDAVNTIIITHNTATDNFLQTVGEARKKLEESIVAESLKDYQDKKSAIPKVSNECEAVQKTIDELTSEIGTLERQIIEHRKPAEELNRDLHSYLGHDELKLEVKDNGYQIVRGGQTADALSEGEKTAIAFLYFLKSLADREFNRAEGIVVIDDPVSSLDSNSLFHAFGFMKERTRGVGQLFIFTHNFTFFGQIKNWFNHFKGQRKTTKPDLQPARFYMIDRMTNSKGSPCLSKLDSLLHKYDSEYHYLFSLVSKYASVSSASTDLEQFYYLPNIARRLLETFMAFRRPNETGDLYKQFEHIDFDCVKKTRIIRFLHTHSHNGQIEEQGYDNSILSETPQVLSDVLDLIKAEDEKHFKAMTALVAPSLETTA